MKSAARSLSSAQNSRSTNKASPWGRRAAANSFVRGGPFCTASAEKDIRSADEGKRLSL